MFALNLKVVSRDDDDISVELKLAEDDHTTLVDKLTSIGYDNGDSLLVDDSNLDGAADYLNDYTLEDIEEVVDDINDFVHNFGEEIAEAIFHNMEFGEAYDSMTYVDRADYDTVNAAHEYFVQLSGLSEHRAVQKMVDVLTSGGYTLLDNVYNYDELGQYVVDNDLVDSERLDYYFDYEAFGDDLFSDLDADEVERLEDSGVTPAMYAREVVEEIGFPDDINNYIDYDQLGKDCIQDFNGDFTEYGFFFVD